MHLKEMGLDGAAAQAERVALGLELRQAAPQGHT